MRLNKLSVVLGVSLALTSAVAMASDLKGMATDAAKQQATEAVKGQAGALMPKPGTAGAAGNLTGVVEDQAMDMAKDKAADAVKDKAADAVKGVVK